MDHSLTNTEEYCRSVLDLTPSRSMTMLSKRSSPHFFLTSQTNAWIPLKSSRSNLHVSLEAIPLLTSRSAIGVVILRLSYGDKYNREHGEEFMAMSIENIEIIATVFTQFWAVDMLPFRM